MREIEPQAPQDKNRDIDRINDKEQKEKTASRVGLTRERLYRKIVDGLNAKKMGDIVDDQGNVRRGLIDDDLKQRWAVEQGIKIFQDDKASGVSISTGDITNNTLNVDVSKLTSNQLVDVLMGRFKPVIDSTAITNASVSPASKRQEALDD